MKRVLVLASVLALTACGGSVAPGNAGGGGNGGGGAVVPDAVEAECEDQVGDFVAALQDIDGRLDVGLNFQSYSEKVGDASVAYQRIDVEDLGLNCLDRVGVPAEDALNAYVAAYNTWNDCIGDTDCDNDSIRPQLQENWAEASDLIEQASDALDE